MAYSDLRSRDNFVEKELAKYLDKSLYKLTNFFSSTNRIDNEKMQYRGVDIILSIPSLNLTNIKVDEKAMLGKDYIGKPKNSFILELSFENGADNNQYGWFLNNEIDTDYYLFIWIDQAKCINWIKEKDFETIDFCFVSRKKIKEYLNNKNYSEETLIKINNQIRKDGRVDKSFNRHNEFFFCFSKDLKEKPINIVMKKYVYQYLSEFTGVIYRDYAKQRFKIGLKTSIIHK